MKYEVKYERYIYTLEYFTFYGNSLDIGAIYHL